MHASKHYEPSILKSQPAGINVALQIGAVAYGSSYIATVTRQCMCATQNCKSAGHFTTRSMCRRCCSATTAAHNSAVVASGENTVFSDS
eukprot:3852-Heterococcus_DN1.PRE.3